MWFSGHNHLGQHYRDAIAVRAGVLFIHVGVVGRHAQDKHRHSRIVDIHEDALTIRTFDHVRRCVDEALTCHEPFGLSRLLDYRRTLSGRRMIPMDPATMRQGLTADTLSRPRA